jgi:hypothetical protein
MEYFSKADIDYLFALLLERRKFGDTLEASHAKSICYNLQRLQLDKQYTD